MANTPPTTERCALVMNQLVGLEALRARVPAALRRTVDQLFRAVEDVATELGGRRVGTPGVGVVTIWDDVDRAAAFAARVQLELLARDWPTTLLLRPEAAEVRTPDGALLYRGPRIRSVVHVGTVDVLHRDDDYDVVGGPAVYQLARLMATLHAGQTALSGAAWDALTGPVDGATLADLGAHRLIGVQGTTRMYQLVPESLSARSFPPVRSRDATRSNAPPTRLPFVGRDGDLQALAELVGFGVRAISVVGAPGVGKSGLLRRFVAVRAASFTQEGEGGAWICPVEGPTASHVIASVAATLGVSLRSGIAVDELLRQVGSVLRHRGKMLLAVDGVVAKPETLARCFKSWLATAPELTVIVASRGRLRLRGEIAYELGPLPVVQPEGARNAAAVRLFTERALLASPRFQAGEPATLAAIANLLGGVPLSISLVAGLAATLDAEAMHTEVSQLDGSLDSVIERVWQLLDPSDRHVLSSCAVYPAGFDRLGAEAVVDVEETGIAPGESLKRLLRSGLVLLAEDARTPDIRRFRVHSRVRERALADLAPEDRVRLERRAASRVLGICEPWVERTWGPEGPEVLARLAIEWVNLAGIAARGIGDDALPEDINLALRACGVLWPMVATAGPAELYQRLVSRVLESADRVLDADPYHQVRALAARSGTRRNLGDGSGAQADAERGAEIANRWSDAAGEGRCRAALGLALQARGRREEARDQLAAAVALLSEEPGLVATARGRLAAALADLGELDNAEREVNASLATLTELGWLRHVAIDLVTRAGLQHRRGLLDEAVETLDQACALTVRVGDRRSLALCLVNKALLELSTAPVAEARETLARALEVAQQTGYRSAESRVYRNLARAALAAGELPLAREHLLAAMAIDRDLRARMSEAIDTAQLGTAHQVGGNLSGARDCYERALRVLRDRAPASSVAPLLAWLGALEAESHEPDRARVAFEQALALAQQTGASSVTETVRLLEGVWLVLRGADDPEALEAARLRYQESESSREVDVRIARAHLGHVLEHGLTTD